MLIDAKISKWAKALVGYSLNPKKGDKVLVRGSYLTLPLLKEIYRELLKAGTYPEIRIIENEFSEIFFQEAGAEQLDYISYYEEYVAKNYNGTIYVGGEANTKSLANADPEKIRRSSASRKEISKIFAKRSASGELKWVITHFPVVGSAQEAGMTLSQFEDFVIKSCFLDKADPVKEWQRVHDMQEKIINYLEKKSDFRIVSKDTDVSFRAGGRKWINSDGHHNFPSGEVFTSPIENSMNGHVRFSYPGIYMGKEIENIYIVFKNGKVAEAKAEKGEELLHALLAIDKGASYVGEAAIGTNYGIQRFIKNMLFDEKIGGTVHIALGNGFGEAGGKNMSALHWDMLCDMKKGGIIYADGEPFYRNGKFTLKGIKL